ncbi:unnamed protein product [Taenia asiatica]|uniref:Uncharacterized protein n=1 Tax=Taenia asiatica TaxID=60517 RepID=A0A0R3VZR9_TAEAS|nr:unnamed protein product [Taenia asiatica]
MSHHCDEKFDKLGARRERCQRRTGSETLYLACVNAAWDTVAGVGDRPVEKTVNNPWVGDGDDGAAASDRR